MKRLEYGDIEEFVLDIIDTSSETLDDDDTIYIAAKYEKAKVILSELVRFGYEIEMAELEPADFSGYDDEYMISLFEDEVWCCKAKNDNGYSYFDGSILYVLDDCNSKILSYCRFPIKFEAGIKDIENDICCNGDCACCYELEDTYDKKEKKFVFRDEDGLPFGIEHSYSYDIDNCITQGVCSFFSTDTDELKDIAEIFGIKL